MRILCFGDSITQGFWDEEGGWVQRLRRRHDEQIIPYLDDMTDEVIPEFFNLGISGETSKDLLSRIEQETTIRKFTHGVNQGPLIAIVAIGTNDDIFEHNEQWVSPEQFKRNLEEIVEKLYKLVNVIILVGNPACDEKRTNPVSWGDYYYTNAELDRSERTIASVAFASGIRYVPIYQVFKKRLDAGELLLADGIHPNSVGHALIADAIWPILLDAIKSLK